MRHLMKPRCKGCTFTMVMPGNLIETRNPWTGKPFVKPLYVDRISGGQRISWFYPLRLWPARSGLAQHQVRKRGADSLGYPAADRSHQ